MPFSNPILIETQTVAANQLPGVFETLQGCWKSSSLLWMQANGFPALPGLILSGWTSDSASAVERFCSENDFFDLLIRIEQPGQRWTRRRGGYTIPTDQVQRQVEELEHDGLLAILLEPASPYSDLYSLTTACDLESGKLDVEVVGPGFDASDVLRSDLVPHERFEVALGSSDEEAGTDSGFLPRRLSIIGREDYRASVEQRLEKIGARLRNPSFPDELIGSGSSGVERAALAKEAEQFLRATGQTMLLDHAEEYQPIPLPVLSVFLKEFQRIFESVRTQKAHWQILSLAASFLPRGRFVIWDFFVPGASDTTVLGRI
jgi:hypothetical protein